MAIFISYSSKDYKIVNKIAEDLVKHKYYIWLDKWQLNYGDSLNDRIKNALTDSSLVMIMLSKKSVKSKWCKKELNETLNNEIIKKRSLIFPVLLEPCKIPEFLKDKLGANFTGDYQQGFQELQDNLLKFTDIDLNKVESKEFITDFSISHGLVEDNLLHIGIDSISYMDTKQYSVMCCISILCNPIISKKYIYALKNNVSDYLISQILNDLILFDSKNDLRIIISDNGPIEKNFDIGFDYKLHLYINRLGYNLGYDVLFDYGSILRMAYEKRKTIMKQINLE